MDEKNTILDFSIDNCIRFGDVLPEGMYFVMTVLFTPEFCAAKEGLGIGGYVLPVQYKSVSEALDDSPNIFTYLSDYLQEDCSKMSFYPVTPEENEGCHMILATAEGVVFARVAIMENTTSPETIN